MSEPRTILEEAVRKIRVSSEVMAEWTNARTSDGYLLTWEWGEPDEAGFYEPVITRHEDDRLFPAITQHRLAAALHEAQVCLNWSPGYGYLDDDGHHRDDHGPAQHSEAARVLDALLEEPR